jgi:competence protein ComEA
LTTRAQRGGFRQIDDLREVRGIGPSRLERIRPFLRLEPTNTTVVAGSLADPPASNDTAKNRTATGKKTLSADLRIDVNHASATDLQRLPGIGPVMSQRIIQEREKSPFRKVDELRRVSGIGAKTLEKLRPFITVGDDGPAVAAKPG